jgi:primosomal protein N' (replication factor Y)
LAEFLRLADLPEPTEVLGPVEMPNQPIANAVIFRLTLRAPLSESAALVKAVKDVGAIRSARKSEGALRIRVDPAAVG